MVGRAPVPSHNAFPVALSQGGRLVSQFVDPFPRVS